MRTTLDNSQRKKEIAGLAERDQRTTGQVEAGRQNEKLLSKKGYQHHGKDANGKVDPFPSCHEFIVIGAAQNLN